MLLEELYNRLGLSKKLEAAPKVVDGFRDDAKLVSRFIPSSTDSFFSSLSSILEYAAAKGVGPTGDRPLSVADPN